MPWHIPLLCVQTNLRGIFHSVSLDPCVPQALTHILDCGTGVGSLSWASSAGAETYDVEAVNEDGNMLAFSTNITSGFLSELLCGQQYQFTVRAINRKCSSGRSSPAYLSSGNTETLMAWLFIQSVGNDPYHRSQMLFLFCSPLVPCVPQNVVSELDCMFNFINIRWNISRGAASYLVVAKGPEGPVTTCNTTTQECRLQTLHCSSSYNVSIIAVNQQCNTSGSSILRINTGIVYSFISSALCQYLFEKKRFITTEHANRCKIENKLQFFMQILFKS